MTEPDKNRLLVTQDILESEVASLVDSAPETLDTLSELAEALGNDPNFATTVSTEIGKRALIDGAPAAYNTLGKLVTALQNHELGGSTDASLLSGALTDQVDATDATVDLTLQAPDEVLDVVMPLSEFLEEMYGAFISTISSLDYLSVALYGKSDVGHTHAIGDVSGLQAALDGKAASSHTHAISNVTGLQSALDGKAASSHTHTPGSLGAVAASGAAATLWAGSQSAYDALPAATRNAIGFVAVII